MAAQARDYRAHISSGLSQQRLVVGETDLAIHLPAGLWNSSLEKLVRDALVAERRSLQHYIARHPLFASSHRPLALSPEAPEIARAMARAAAACGVGPMAAVAGQLALVAGRSLAPFTAELMVENGGDLYLAGQRELTAEVLVPVGSPFRGRLAVRVAASSLPCGLCTSSGTLGSSFSYGRADAAMILAPDPALADAAATATANLVQGPEDVESACNFALSIPGVRAALVVCGDALAVGGEIELTPPAGRK